MTRREKAPIRKYEVIITSKVMVESTNIEDPVWIVQKAIDQRNEEMVGKILRGASVQKVLPHKSVH